MKLFSSLFAIIISLVVPICTAIWLSAKKKGSLKPILLGAATFFVFQILLRLPALQLLGKTIWFSIFSATQPILYALLLAGTAALFEEGGRYLVMRRFMKDRHRINDGIAFGVGHGGIEAILLVGFNAALMLILNYSSINSGSMFAGGVERLSTMVVHISWSVMVLKSVVLRKPLWLLLAFVLHTAIDLSAVLLPAVGASALVIEAVIFGFALLHLGYIVLDHHKYKGGAIQ